MPSPSLAIGSVKAGLVENAAGVGLEVVHHALRRGIGIDDDVDMIGPDVRGYKNPSALLGAIDNCGQNSFPSGLIEGVRRLSHEPPLQRHATGVGRQSWAARLVVSAVDSAILSMQVGAVAAEGDQVRTQGISDPTGAQQRQ